MPFMISKLTSIPSFFITNDFFKKQKKFIIHYKFSHQNIPDPNCSFDCKPFTQKEKDYICEWVEDYLAINKSNISWKVLQSEVKNKFGVLRSQNDLKDIWNAKKRRLED